MKLSAKWVYLKDAPFKISEQCCDVMKKKPFAKYSKETGRKPITGQMAVESEMRERVYLQRGCNAFEKGHEMCNPLSFWTEQDILKYLRDYSVAYCDQIYGAIVEEDGVLSLTGCNRTGCVFCGFGCHLEKGKNRFQRLKISHPKLWEYCMDKLGMRDVLNYIGIPYE